MSSRAPARFDSRSDLRPDLRPDLAPALRPDLPGIRPGPEALAALKTALRVLAPRRVEGVAPIGLPSVDELLGGGLLKGRLTELSGRRSAGRTAFLLSALAAAIGRDEASALVDVGGVLDVRRAAAAGIPLERLLWLRAGDAKKGLQAADLVLGAGGFGLVVLDLGEALPRLPDTSWLRLSRTAERSQAALLVVSRVAGAPGASRILSPLSPTSLSSPTSPMSPTSGVTGSFAAIKLEAKNPGDPRFLPSERALLEQHAELWVARSRRGDEGRSVRLPLRLR